MSYAGYKMAKHEELKKLLYRVQNIAKEADEEFEMKGKVYRDQIRDLLKEKVDFRNKYEEEIKKTNELMNRTSKFLKPRKLYEKGEGLCENIKTITITTKQGIASSCPSLRK